MKEFLKIGQILKPQGIRGEVKLKPFVDDLDRFYDLETVYLKQKGTYEKFQVESARTYKQFAYLKLAGIEDRNTSETLRNLSVYVDRANAAKLPEGAFYIADLIGLSVYDDAGACLGTLEEIMQTGGVDVYAVKGERSFLFPAAPGVILERNLETGRIVLDGKRLKEVRVDG